MNGTLHHIPSQFSHMCQPQSATMINVADQHNTITAAAVAAVAAIATAVATMTQQSQTQRHDM